jgi:hypothetical protein
VKRLDRNLVARAVELAVLTYVIIAARAWLAVVVLALALLVVVLAAALIGTRVRLREITAHDRAVSYYLATYYGSDYAPAEGDEVHR